MTDTSCGITGILCLCLAYSQVSQSDRDDVPDVAMVVKPRQKLRGNTSPKEPSEERALTDFDAPLGVFDGTFGIDVPDPQA